MTRMIIGMCLAASVALAQTNEPPKLAYADVTFDQEAQKEIRSIGMQAYAKASAHGLTSMDGTIIKGGFVLANDEEGLGKKGDRIAEVQIRIFAGEQTRGLVLVNVETKTPHVVFPGRKNKKTPNQASDATSEPAPSAASSSHQR
jgi:hypothetical protein